MIALFLGVECPVLTPNNAFLSTDDLSVNAWVTVTCHTGWIFDDDTTQRTVRCQSNGKWHEDPGSCQRKLYHSIYVEIVTSYR